MKHAILLLGHRNFEYVKSRIEKLDSDFYVFIHWDKRFSLTDEQREWIASQKQIVFGQEYECNWGGFNMTKAEVWLCEQALQNKEIEYFHLVSDMDMMIPSVEVFKRFFDSVRGKSFLQYTHKSGRSSVVFENMAYYHYLDTYNIRENEGHKKTYYTLFSHQIGRKKYRELPNVNWYVGDQWWSLYRDKVEYLVSQKDFIYKWFVDTRYSDTMFAQMVILNGCADNIINNSLRCVLWFKKNGNCPAVMDEEEFDSVIEWYNERDCMFVRKIDPNISKNLIDKIEEWQERQCC